MLDLPDFEGFEWDEGNETKNWDEHGVRRDECEQVFFNRPLLIHFDEAHSQVEERFFLLGRTDASRKLFVVFTRRGKRVRVISARDMTKAERRIYLERA